MWNVVDLVTEKWSIEIIHKKIVRLRSIISATGKSRKVIGSCRSGPGIDTKMEAVFQSEYFWIFSMISGPFLAQSARKWFESAKNGQISLGNRRNLAGKIRRLSGGNTASMFRCFPAGTGSYFLTWPIQNISSIMQDEESQPGTLLWIKWVLCYARTS